jgi:hypothetical protein
MDAWVWIVIAVAAVVVIGAIAWYMARERRTRGLQEQFGPEYDRTVEDAPTRREAEAELAERRERRDELDITPLSPTSRERYLRSWEDTQARFVDDPEGAVGEADGLIQDVMRERGYPVDDFERRESDISVDHPDVVENYREAHAISRKTVHGDAETEDLRQAMVHYRALFDALVVTGEPAGTGR